jgi:hypothetical protein
VSARVAFNLREEREVPRVQALLDLSKLATQGLYVAMYVLLGAVVFVAPNLSDTLGGASIAKTTTALRTFGGGWNDRRSRVRSVRALANSCA